VVPFDDGCSVEPSNKIAHRQAKNVPLRALQIAMYTPDAGDGPLLPGETQTPVRLSLPSRARTAPPPPDVPDRSIAAANDHHK
jgi:hypothetical protein